MLLKIVNKEPKIYLGTGQLGRKGSLAKKIKQLQIIKQQTEIKVGLHISPTYGKSFYYLKNLDLNNFFYPPIVKIDFSDVSHPQYQLNLVRRLLKNRSFYIQIAGDIRNNSYFMSSSLKFLNNLNNLKKKFNILGYYLTIHYHDRFEAIKKILASDIIFGIAIHHSLIELEADIKIIKQVKKQSKHIISLRVFGESLTNYGNWLSDYCPEEKPESLIKEQINNLDILLYKNSITKAEARLIYALNNSITDTAILSLSSEDQLSELLKIKNSKYQNSLIKELENYNLEFSNKNRKGLGFRYPSNELYFNNHSLFYFFYYCLISKKFTFFFYILAKKIIRFLKNTYKKNY